MTSSGRLHYDGPDDAATRAALRRASALNIDMTVDIGRARSFIADPAGRSLTGVGGLQLHDEAGDLNEQLRQLRSMEASLKLQRILERAQRALEAKRHDAALALTEEALGVNRTSAVVWLVKAQCHLALREYETALQSIAVAREHARDHRAMSVALALRTACERQTLRDFEVEVVELLEQDRLPEAIERVERRLRDQPDNVDLCHHYGLLLLLAGRPAEARRVVQEALLRNTDEANTDRLTKLLAAIARREGQSHIERARHALRGGDAPGALAQLESCATTFGDDKQFVALHSYALQKARPGRAFIRRWQRGAEREPIAYPTLQRLIEWLVREELEAGITALASHNFDAAAKLFSEAEKIDDRCAAVAFLYGVALYQGMAYRFEHGKNPPSLDEAEAILRTAAQLAARAVGDPDVGRQSRNLGASLEAELNTLAQVRVRIERSRAVVSWIKRFNTLVAHYERNPIRSHEQLAAARRAFDALSRQVAGSRGLYERDSEEGRVLADLTTALQRIRSQLARP